MDPVTIRAACPGDLAQINRIYNLYVLASTSTYQEEPETADGRAAWFDSHGPEHPVIVAQVGPEIAGWGALSPFHRRSAYRRTVEDSIYVDPPCQRRGIGRALLVDLLERARLLGHHAVIALIDAQQEASIILHAKQGFTDVGLLRQVGYKFGRYLDVRYMEKII